MEGNYKKWINRINSKQDVLTDDNVGSFMDLELPTKLTPTSGDTVLARDILTNKAVEIPIESLGGGGSGLALGETSSTAYRGDRGKIAYDHSQTIGNPHGTTKNDIGLGNVDNTSDLNKPISTATQTALNNKLDKGTYTGTASDLLLNDQNLENSKQKKVTAIPITGNITLSEIHNGAILHVTNTCNITIPTGLDANFQCVVYAKGSIIVTFVNGGVTINSPSGLLLKTDKMASLFASASNTFNLLGELATS